MFLFLRTKRKALKRMRKLTCLVITLTSKKKILKLWKAGRIIETSLRINFDYSISGILDIWPKLNNENFRICLTGGSGRVYRVSYQDPQFGQQDGLLALH